QQTVIVGRDGRDSGEELSEALCRGLMDSGRDVVRIGVVPTPLLYFATHFLGSNTGVMITGSHNPVEYNGLKIVVGGEALEGDSIQALGQRIENGNLLQGNGMDQDQELIQDYIARVTEDVQLARPLKVVVDSGNGSAGLVAPDLLRALGCDVIELFSEIDGSFPNHHPDPSKPENLQTLITMVRERKADIGIAFDGDGDRLGVVDSDGKIIWPDRLLMLFARDVLARQPGSDVIFDVKSTRHLATEVLGYGGRPIMWKTGHSPIKAKMKETGALLAGEMSGHIFFRERWYGFDDGVYSCARLLEILSTEPLSSAEVFAELPESVSTPELQMEISREKGAGLLADMADQTPFPDAKLVTMDGVRAEFRDGWGLVRLSNTTPSMVFRFEADSQEVLEKIQGMFRERLLALDPALALPF
ncbi:MAG: phosphomannomutase/phosphoglucomutase, partial [Candidatus Sedimenticola sp. 6PFRAG7]